MIHDFHRFQVLEAERLIYAGPKRRRRQRQALPGAPGPGTAVITKDNGTPRYFRYGKPTFTHDMTHLCR